MKINGLILAAGSSTRLGQIKQLVKYKNKFLINHIEDMLLDVCDSVYIVLGSNNELISPYINTATILVNKNWQKGMSSSLSYGIANSNSKASATLITVCDQPLIPKNHYKNLIKYYKQNPKKIICTKFNNTIGSPVIFPKKHNKELLLLNDKKLGAKSVIKNNLSQVIMLSCQEASFDLDTRGDLARLFHNI